MINTPYAVIGGLVYGYLIFMILPIYGSLERMDRSVIEAGKDLYGTPLQTFLHVTLPQTKQGILAGCVLVFLPAVGDFVSAQLLGGPDTYMVGNLIQDQFFAANNWPFGSALTVVMMLFLVGLDGRLPALGRARRARRGGDATRERSAAFDKPRLPARSAPALGLPLPVRPDRRRGPLLVQLDQVAADFEGFSLQWYREFSTTRRCASRSSPRSRSP